MTEHENSITMIESTGQSAGESPDAELKAINAVVGALAPLDEEQRNRALEYVLRRFNAVAFQEPPVATLPPGLTASPHESHPTPIAALIQDIRTLKEAKAPKTANEMAALVAYYLSELAPSADRKTEITASDIHRYFKSAGFRLPANPGFTLVNAKNAGYLDSAGTGQYKLNPVGYNLVAYRMGVAGDGKGEAGRRRPHRVKRVGRNAKKPARVRK